MVKHYDQHNLQKGERFGAIAEEESIMMGGMAANSYSRKLSDHIFNFNHEVERERELEVGEVVNSQRPAPVMFFLVDCIPPTQTVPPNEDQALQHLSLWGGVALLIQTPQSS